MMDAYWLPVIFIGLMGLSVLIYAILDGYDLGVGILLPMGEADEAQRDTMIASIGPFWDANETWLVLAVGIMLIAFPAAHSIVLYHLYIPVAIMLIGLIMRGVAFDFRAKAAVDHKLAWDRTFKAGSILTTLAQGYMLGLYVMGFEGGISTHLFGLLSGLGVTAAYSYIGAAWLVMKTEDSLQQRAVAWTKTTGRFCFMGVIAVSIVNPLVNPGVFDRWFDFPLVMFVLLMPALCFAAFLFNDFLLGRLPKENDRHCWVPFSLVMLIFLLCFSALGFSFFPDVVPGQMDIWEAASAPESLVVILVGALVVVPVILAYTAFSYWVFRGKATSLNYH
ncbi:cytochrome d ubiquinol oxidase subunit II [Agarivorans aestuarii]|uniref:Cytochrome d ubiquinol oxidase subunit II n=1 Tax=Agarivorans aestuarii TaxID=1563703 RepID=A0ABU7G9V5_9ALTE|nr:MULTISPECIES: cytochrome d ubiquinol oxidase subunit II [Agarivorans]MEE1676156.1 cytochrome d ubiquinol oxidase subunit II [Agarivorans aestuarii]